MDTFCDFFYFYSSHSDTENPDFQKFRESQVKFTLKVIRILKHLEVQQKKRTYSFCRFSAGDTPT